MRPDILELREFYARPAGRAAALRLGEALFALWPDATAARLAGLGYCEPWLDRLSAGAERAVALMPAGQGSVHWPQGRPNAAALVDEEQLPLGDAMLDRILAAHLLEHAESPGDVLREIWRVLAPGGKVLLVVPNRRGLWARSEHTPFGVGRPFSASQIAALLAEALLTPTAWSRALAFPPARNPALLTLGQRLEGIGRRLWPAFSGAILVEAQKKMLQGKPAAARQSRRVFVPVFLPQGAATAPRG
jgi:SAM-dependent methyltransferase